MRFPEDHERSKTLETSPPFLTFGSLTVPYFLSYSLIILSKARFIKSLIAIPSLAAYRPNLCNLVIICHRAESDNFIV